jgi:DNA-binding XRE family transcriptional regulator
MLDFTKDTDWYISPHYFVRKLNETDTSLINPFIHDYGENYLGGEEIISQAIELLDSLKHEVINRDKIFIAGVMDKRNAQLKGLICITANEGNSGAKLNLFLSVRRLSVSVISELLIWMIDHTFYSLHFNKLHLCIDKRCENLVTALHKLELECFEQLSSVVFLSSPACVYSNVYHLNERQWLNDKASGVVQFNHQEADKYIQEVVRPYFQTCVVAPMYALIVDFRYETVMATNKTANSVGLTHWDETTGTSYKYYSRLDLAIWYFGARYNSKTATAIHHYARKIFRIQQYVFKTGHPASFIDSLPYDKQIKSYLVTYIPIFNPHGDVIAIQSVAFDYRLAGYHEYIQNILEQKKRIGNISKIKLSKREDEVLFLLTCGITQEQIAEILEIKRDTVAAIIRNQLHVKFSLPAVNTKLLVETALSYGFPFSIPESLWCPSVVILEEKLSNWVKRIAKLSVLN